LAVVGQRSRWWRRRKGQGGALHSHGGHCGGGGARRWPKAALDGEAALAGEEEGGQLRHFDDSLWRTTAQVHGRLGVASRSMRGCSVVSARRLEDKGVAMKEQRRGERRGREGGLHLSMAATGDKDRAVRCMGYAWRPGGQVARAVRRELPLGGGRSRDRRSVRTRAGTVGLNGSTVALGRAQFTAQCFSKYLKTA
jgi:hypothetical protein